MLLDAAHRARNATPEEFEVAESDLSEALRAVFAEAGDMASWQDEAVAPLVAELARDCAKVELARRFHNDVVVSARSLRSRHGMRQIADDHDLILIGLQRRQNCRKLEGSFLGDTVHSCW